MEKTKVADLTPEEEDKIKAERFIAAYQALSEEHGLMIVAQTTLIVAPLPEEPKE